MHAGGLEQPIGQLGRHGAIADFSHVRRALEDVGQHEDVHQREMRRDVVLGDEVRVDGSELQRLEGVILRGDGGAAADLDVDGIPHPLLDELRQLGDLVITKIPFTMSSSHTSGVAAHEDKHTRAKGRIDGDS